MTASTSTGRLVKHSTIYAFGNISRQLVGFLMLPVYTRFLTPADYGVVGLLTFAMSIMEPFFGARLGEAMPKFYFDELQRKSQRENTVISTAFIVTSVVSAATSVIVFLIQAPASQLLFGSTEYALAVGIFGFQILTQAVEYYGLTYIRIQQRPYMFIAITLSKLCLQLFLNVLLVVHMKLGVMGVVYSAAISSTTYALGLTAYVLWRTGYRFDYSIARKMLIFSWPLWFAGLASLYLLSSNRYYIRIFSSLDEVGLYELAAKFSIILLLVVWQPFSQFWETERFRYYQSPNAAAEFRGVFRGISMLLVVAALGISIFAKPVIELMAAPTFHDASLCVPLLTLAWLFNCLILFCNFSFFVTEKTHLISRNTYVAAVLVTIFNVVLIPHYGELGAATSLAVALALQFGLVVYAAKPNFDMQLDLKGLAVLIAGGTAAYVLANHVFAQSNIVYDIVVKILVYCAFVALLLAALWRNEQSRELFRSLLTPLLSRLSPTRS